MTQWELAREELFFDQPPIGNTVSSLYFWSTDSRLINCVGKLFTTANLTALDTVVKNFTQIGITSDLGSEGSYQIMRYKTTRKQAMNYTPKWYEVTMELRQVG
jgi:hypothetical protein